MAALCDASFIDIAVEAFDDVDRLRRVASKDRWHPPGPGDGATAALQQLDRIRRLEPTGQPTGCMDARLPKVAGFVSTAIGIVGPLGPKSQSTAAEDYP